MKYLLVNNRITVSINNGMLLTCDDQVNQAKKDWNTYVIRFSFGYNIELGAGHYICIVCKHFILTILK